MANSISASPPVIIVDTAYTDPDTFLKDVALGKTPAVKVKSLRWVGATTAGHECVVQDRDSEVIWAAKAEGANVEVVDDVCKMWTNGFKVPTLGSGKLYIALA